MRRLAQGLQANVAYTWSKAFGICCDTLSDNPPQVQALEYFQLNEARLPQDRPHNFQASFVAELPFGAGKPFLSEGGIAAALFGGWQVNGLLSVYSGAPFTITSSGTSLDLPGSTQFADQVKDQVEIPGGIGPGQPWFDTSAFRPVTERRFGTAGVNSMRGPGFRMEIFNLTNTPHFANPQNSVNAANFGIISGTANSGREGIDERLFRLGLRIKF
jgi:hypothetical protein